MYLRSKLTIENRLVIKFPNGKNLISTEIFEVS